MGNGCGCDGTTWIRPLQMHLSLDDGPEDEKHFVLITFDLEMGWSQNTHSCTTLYRMNGKMLADKRCGRHFATKRFEHLILPECCTSDCWISIYRWECPISHRNLLRGTVSAESNNAFRPEPTLQLHISPTNGLNTNECIEYNCPWTQAIQFPQTIQRECKSATYVETNGRKQCEELVAAND